jgi:hypothetical protein
VRTAAVAPAVEDNLQSSGLLAASAVFVPGNPCDPCFCVRADEVLSTTPDKGGPVRSGLLLGGSCARTEGAGSTTPYKGGLIRGGHVNVGLCVRTDGVQSATPHKVGPSLRRHL